MISLVLILIASLFFMGIIIRTKSITSGRKGPGIFQPMKDIVRLWKKGAVYSETTSFIFQIAPSIYFASILMAVLVIPFGSYGGVISFNGDFVFFAYVLALGKFFSIIGALDTGSSFEGMGASREALYSLLAEPAFFILMGSFALFTGHTSFVDIFTSLHFGTYISYALGILATFILIMIAMIENSRMPIDDPKTHLELTMVHEVMILDNSGFDLGLILYGTHLKFAMYGALIANFFTDSFPFYISIPIFLAVQFIFAIIVGMLESFNARFRMGNNAQFIFTLTSLSLLIFFGVLLILKKII
ncbi:MAG: formate hydrogenlyase [Flavobacteriales bacterium CG18_big_fil_WC_8_21_14_2_50_32_9]|nr:formate hydrogenlyase [Flavobacteriales bacterium]NCT16137.1 formate hydrogenlyase [Flavobacteriales bacterium]PIQ15885.1 MAG: formate hydrogenlyase [Flavobacteriales bacterium CG18_big_fil_WC_8_21_14_2_50_32_9]